MLEYDDVAQELMARFAPVNDDEASPYELVNFVTLNAQYGTATFYIRKDNGKVFEVTVHQEHRA